MRYLGRHVQKTIITPFSLRKNITERGITDKVGRILTCKNSNNAFFYLHRPTPSTFSFSSAG
jgi:hypothetical protein